MAHPLEPAHDLWREGALESAILLREQAIKWRRSSITVR
jgi:hypothetical protein